MQADPLAVAAIAAGLDADRACALAERAAILEYDARLPRAQSGVQAALQTFAPSLAEQLLPLDCRLVAIRPATRDPLLPQVRAVHDALAQGPATLVELARRLRIEPGRLAGPLDALQRAGRATWAWHSAEHPLPARWHLIEKENPHA